MPIDIDKLMAFAIPSVRQDLTPEAIALYALSVGVGADPLDLSQLPYVDPLQGPRVLPSMVLVMAHPGFWMGNPRSGIDPAAVLHAAQGFEITGPLPASGPVESRTRVTGVVDKGAGKPALVLVHTDLSDGVGRAFARLDRSVFIRDGGGFGGDVGEAGTAERARTPDRAPDLCVDLPTAPNQALLYRLNGDTNPLHSDPALAARQGFERPILHGLCTMGVVAHALLKGLAGYDADRLRAVSLRFCKPVHPGETIRTEIWSDGAFRARVLERDALVIDQGRAEVGARTGTREVHHAGQ